MGMTSGHPRDELLALIELRLDASSRARVEAHLAGCPACRAEAAELMQINDTLGALPAALRALPDGRAGGWSAVWARVQAGPIRRVVPQLNLYLSLAAVVFVLAAALPAGLGAQPLAVTAGVIQTPAAAQATPVAGKGAAAGVGQVSTALAHLATPARPAPNPTPVPDVQG
jgi:anti-sigma factor RsiW